ncbi:MAG: hypothetical protein EA397_02420 [Deltaproteobacteria bacterium]|nr:MAG: hypothetical protein EA397_02420 [Deltaproteobacteria bacterium]
MSASSRRPIRWSARQRLERLVDPGSEAGTFDPTGALWVGTAEVEGRAISLLVSDVQVDRGALGAQAAAAATAEVRRARSVGRPVVWLVDSDGARTSEGLPAVERCAELLAALAEARGECLRLAVSHGLAGGVAAYGLALCDLSVGIAERSFTFVAGPAVVQSAIGERTPLDALGGTPVHLAAGTLTEAVPADPEALTWVRTVLGFVRRAEPIPATERSFELPEPHRPYPSARVRRAIVDEDTFLPLYRGFGSSVTVGLARVMGWPLLLIQSEPTHLGGAIDVEAARKVARVLDLAIGLDLPILTLCDTPGFLPGRAQERAGVLVEGARLIHAYATARGRVPTASVILRRAVGAGAVLAFGSTVRLALPGAELMQMGASAMAAAYQRSGTPSAPPATVITPEHLRARIATWLEAEKAIAPS